MKTKLLYITIACLSLIACGKTQHTTTATEEPVSLSMDSIAADTSKVLIADLPVRFDSTAVLIQGICFQSVKDKEYSRRSIISKKADFDFEDSGFSFNSHSDIISGGITNLYFDNTETNEQRLLTNQALNIIHINYLRHLAKKIGKDYLIYRVYDKDYNGDGKLDYNDISALYVSTLDGKDFTKITADYHAYVDGSMSIINLRYYFRTFEDVDKNCSFDKKTDKYHYYYIDFSVAPYKVVEYNPLGTIQTR